MSREEYKPDKVELAKVLAVLLTELGSPSYIDKLSQASSKDLVLYRIEEALRDYHSLVSKGVERESTKELINTIDFHEIEKFMLSVREAADLTQLRELVSLTTAYALAEAARLQSRDTYLLASRVVDYLKREGLLKEGVNVQEVSKIIEGNAEKIARDLSISVGTVQEISKETYLLERILRKA